MKMKILALIENTLRESMAKKVFIGFFAISTITLLIFIFVINLDIVDGAFAVVNVFGQELDRGRLVDVWDIMFVVQSAISVALFTAGIFLSIFATADIIPKMLSKGSIDLLLSKPLSRIHILIGKYLGALLIVIFNVFYLIGGMWLILSLKTKIWNFGFLSSGLIITVTFSILLALIFFVGLRSRSSGLTIMVVYLVIFLSPLLAQREKILVMIDNVIYRIIISGAYYILPKIQDLGNICRLLVEGDPVRSWMPLFSSLLFGIGMFALSGLYFARKNY